MAFKRVFLPLFLLFSILLGVFGFHSSSNASGRYSFVKGSSYTKEWAKADSLISKGLPKSAMDVVMNIFARSKAEHNTAQTVKAILYKLRLESQTEENASEKAVAFLKSETKTSTYPLTQVLHSLLGDVYWQYYSANRWKFYNRTQTVGFKNDDLATWDLNHLVDQCTKEYQASLHQSDSLAHTKLDLLDDILTTYPDSRKFRPTVYDFLAHRAIDFYSNNEPDLVRPAYRFDINKADYLLPAEAFCKLTLETKDSMSLKFYALNNLQHLLSVHLNDAEPSALLDADLKRIQFVKAHAAFENKDSLYLKALLQLQNLMSQKHPAFDGVTEVDYALAQWHANQGSLYNPHNSENDKWEKKTALDLCKSTINKYPKAFGAQQCAALEISIQQKSMTLTTEKVNIADKPFRALLSYQNLSKVYVRIAKMDIDKFNRLSQKYYGEELIKQYLKLPTLKEWELSLPEDADYNTHSTEIKIPELPFGHYLILTASDKNFSYKQAGISYTPVWISNLSYINRRKTDGSMDFYVMHRENGEPQKEVSAQLWFQKYNERSREYDWIKSDQFKTDETGYFKVPAPGDYRNFNIELTKGADHFFPDNSYYQYQGYQNPKTKTPKTFFFTDREIYRPGQTVFFKGICLQSDGETNEVLTNRGVTVTFYDANSQKISSQDLISNDFGSVSGSFVCPQGVLNGQMYINDGYGSKYFSVEEYKRPKFEVTVKPVSEAYRLNDSVRVLGTARAYSGANIDGAAVKYRVVRNASFPNWFYWWRGYSPASPETEIGNGFTTTNDTGGYVIRFKASPDATIPKDYSPTYTYSVYADVTDLNGETHSSTGFVSVGYKAMTLTIQIPDRLNKEEVQKFPVTTANLNGQFEPAKGKIDIYRLKDPGRSFRKREWQRPDKNLMSKEEFSAAFPQDVYQDEDNVYKWAKGEKVQESVFSNTSANGGTVLSPKSSNHTDTLQLKNQAQWSNGYYVLEATTTDRFGEEVKEVRYFQVYGEHETVFGGTEIDQFSALKSTGEPGEKAKLLFASKGHAHVLYELEYKNEVIKREWLNIENEQRTLEIPITEKDRGGFAYHLLFVKDNRFYQHDGAVTVPWTNKQLDIEFETFRNKLEPGQTEEWKLKVHGKKGEKVVAELMATLYDASLDAFRPNSWDFNIYNSYYSNLYWSYTETFGTTSSQLYGDYWNTYAAWPTRYYETLNWFGYSYYNYRGGYYQHASGGFENSKAMAEDAIAAPAPASMGMSKESSGKNEKKGEGDKTTPDSNGPIPILKTNMPGVRTSANSSTTTREESKDAEKANAEPVKARSNFAETAFFYPMLSTDANGEVIVKFTVPEALTRWKMMGFAHTKDLKYGSIGNTLVTQKDLMVVPDAPRFFRENDTMAFTVKVTSLADTKLDGTAQLQFFDALTQQPLDEKFLGTTSTTKPFGVAKGASTVLSWTIHIPEGLGALTYKVTARAGKFTDGEEMAVPVLTNRMLVTESMPLPIRSKQTKVFNFEKFISQNNHSTTLRNHKFTLEFTANPAWYAVQALPYLMEYPYECAEQTFSRFYANSIATHIANSSPKIKAVFESWKSQSPDALLSNLQKNQELKSLLLEETPWVLDAKNESERKKRVALLFDLNKMSTELDGALRKLQKMQMSNGGWPWFEGMPDDRYITQHILTGMGHLDHLSIKSVREDSRTWTMVQSGMAYLDNRIREDYEWILKYDKAHVNDDHLNYEQIQYLYTRSYFKDIPVEKNNQKAVDYYTAQAKKYWTTKGRYMQGMIALAMFRSSDKKTPGDILKSLKETSLNSEEMGMYWKENYDGFYWYQAPIESQALLIEAFDEISHDQKVVDDLKVWLLKSKQTQDWKTTKATTEACYALLLRGTDWLATESNVEIKLGEQVIDPKKMEDVKVEAGTGYFKKSWSGSDINTTMGHVTVSKKDEGVSWGAVYWQYFEQLDKITPHDTPLKLKKQLFVERNTAAGPVLTPIASQSLKPGDKIKVRIELRVDRDMQYVHMKDMRASCFEPTNVISQYKWQDGLGYYESTKDASTNFFFSWLPKGTYVFEYPMLVTHTGDFSNGITSIQCMYAPEFASHSEGVRVKVGR